jgi:hypothetical protein
MIDVQTELATGEIREALFLLVEALVIVNLGEIQKTALFIKSAQTHLSDVLKRLGINAVATLIQFARVSVMGDSH